MPLYPAATPSGQFLYLPTGWDAAWKAAKATVGSSRVNVVGIGDSVIAGQNSTDIMVNSAWAVLRAKLLAANNNALSGDHYSLLYSAKYGLGTATPPVVINGTQGTDYAPYYCGLNYGSFGGQTTLTPAVTCTPPYSVVGFDILYIDYSAGSFTYNVDGGSKYYRHLHRAKYSGRSYRQKGEHHGTHTRHTHAQHQYQCIRREYLLYSRYHRLCVYNGAVFCQHGLVRYGPSHRPEHQ